jgi:uncharacterized membrane protein YbhN (UPF0104 family)
MSGLLTTLGSAAPEWILAAALCFALALLCSAVAWSIGLRACGGRAPFHQVAGRYAIGSLVNALAPAQLGGAARIGLLSRTLPDGDRVLRAGGVGSVLALARAAALALVVLTAAATGRIPIWPAPVLALVAVGVFVGARRAGPHLGRRLRSGLEVFGSARSCGRASGWIAGSFAVRLAGAWAVANAFGVSQSLAVAIVLLWAVAVAGIVPLTPGNLGVGAGAATVALHGIGVEVGTALAIGVAFQAVETLAGVTLGVVGAAVVAAPGTRTRRLAVAAAVAGVLAAATLGAAAVDLV